MKVRHKKQGGPEIGFKRRRMSSAATKKVIVEFPRDLLERTEQRASDLSTNRSKLIRSAVEQYLEFSLRRELERALAEGYRANDSRDREISQEFKHIDSEI